MTATLRTRITAAAILPALLLTLSAGAPAAAQDDGYAPECAAPTATPTLVVGDVACQKLVSEFLGGPTAVSYYIPPQCAADGDAAPCPVEYFLHGTGGSHRTGLGRVGEPNARVRALNAAPPVDPRADPEPWQYADPSTWVPADPIDLILVSPDGRTVPGGRGPTPGVDTGWADWHPKYAAGGEYERYPTPPPELEQYLVRELVPWVDEHFATIPDWTARAITGHSQGGFGSFAIGLAHPDEFAVLGMFSGGGFPFPALIAEGQDVPPGTNVSPPADLPHAVFPGPAALLSPESLWSQTLIAEATVGFGDPVVDNVWWRGINPVDLIGNARAFTDDGTQVNRLKYHVNDAVARRPQDFEPPSFPGNQVFETALFPLDLYMEQIFDALEVERVFHIGPGLHHGPYQDPYQREHHEFYAAHMAGTGEPRPFPTIFDHRSHRYDFEVWDWVFHVDRGPREFLFLTDVTCASLTVRGTGVVTVTPPARCGVDPVDVDLGSSFPFDEPLGAGSLGNWGNVVTVDLTPTATPTDPSTAPAPGTTAGDTAPTTDTNETAAAPTGGTSLPSTGGTTAGAAALLVAASTRRRRRR